VEAHGIVRLIASLVASLLALTLACSGDSGPPTSDIVSTIPWSRSGGEILLYSVVNDDGESQGQITLSVAPAGSDTTLGQFFDGERTTDEIEVVVDSPTLKPKSSRRSIETPTDTEVIETTYTPEGALIRQGERQSGLSVPEHAYDNDSSLFLWRTIDFRDGYEASYITIITNRRERQKVVLRVRGKETVHVPAGEFTAWHLEVRTSNARQHAWFADTPARHLVRYDNDRGLIFELESRP
jgi:hypothetical protein